ncbi:MAG: YigZ family protein [Lachnospiraceae bacterium]|nr:YigZ family protein [Lachnospiraceae bacterium]
MADNKPYKTITKGGCGEIVEKKSRFIANIIPCEDEESALTFIESTRKTYWDARHNCYAYTIGVGNTIERSSDDGEPAKTAGRPMLDVLLSKELHNICVVVTRYFGGTLLGTGGLVRAYQGAVTEGLKNCTMATIIPGVELLITTDYTDSGKIKFQNAEMKITTLNEEYTDKVAIKVLVPLSGKDAYIAAITEASNGKAVIEELSERSFAAEIENNF